MSAPSAFVGSIPQTYDRYLGPLIFDAYARDMVERLRPKAGQRVLELAAGTGIVTQQLAGAMAGGAGLTATDLNEPMLAVARQRLGPGTKVVFRQADACELPFPDRSFDLLACQYGLMFFPDKAKAMREARRVLAPGGRYVFNVWDSLAHNPIPRAVHEAVAARFPKDPPNFLAAAPYGYNDRAEIERILKGAGFTNIQGQAVEFPSTAPAAEDAARGFLEGTPLFLAVQERGVSDIAPIREAATQAVARTCGDRPCRSTMRALVFTAS